MRKPAKLSTTSQVGVLLKHFTCLLVNDVKSALRKRKRNEDATYGSHTSVSPDRESRSLGSRLLGSGVRHYHDDRTRLIEIAAGTYPGSFLFSDGSAHRRHGTVDGGRHGGGACLCCSCCEGLQLDGTRLDDRVRGHHVKRPFPDAHGRPPGRIHQRLVDAPVPFV